MGLPLGLFSRTQKIQRLDAPIVVESEVHFALSAKDLSRHDHTEPITADVDVTLARDAPNPAALIYLVTAYVGKQAFNLGTSPGKLALKENVLSGDIGSLSSLIDGDWPEDAYLRALSDARETGRWESIGDVAVGEVPTEARQASYHGIVYRMPVAWTLQTPYTGKNTGMILGPLAAFALLRAVWALLDEEGRSALTRVLSKLVTALESDSSRLSPQYLAGGVHTIMRNEGVAADEQVPQWEEFRRAVIALPD